MPKEVLTDHDRYQTAGDVVAVYGPIEHHVLELLGMPFTADIQERQRARIEQIGFQPRYYEWLNGVPRAQVFDKAKAHLSQIFVESKHLDPPKVYPRIEALRVLMRAEKIAKTLQEKLQGTAFLPPYPKLTREHVVRFKQALKDFAPLHVSSNQERTYKYPLWDQTNYSDQEIGFNKRTGSHLEIVERYVEAFSAEWNRQLPELRKKFPQMHLSEIDILKAKVIAIGHDLGRYITHDPEVHDKLVELIFYYLGFNESIFEYEFDYQGQYLSGNDSDVNPRFIHPGKVMMFLADFHGKFTNEGDPTRLRRFDDFEESIRRRIGQYNKVITDDPILDQIREFAQPLKTYYLQEYKMLTQTLEFFREIGFYETALRLEEQINEQVMQELDTGRLHSRPIARLDQEHQRIEVEEAASKLTRDEFTLAFEREYRTGTHLSENSLTHYYNRIPAYRSMIRDAQQRVDEERAKQVSQPLGTQER